MLILLLASSMTIAKSDQDPPFKGGQIGDEHRYLFTVKQKGIIVFEQNTCLTYDAAFERAREFREEYPGSLVLFEVISVNCFPRTNTGGGGGGGTRVPSGPNIEFPK